MTVPIRVQLSRAKGWRMPPDTTKVDRSTRWGNPHIVGIHGDAQECVDKFTVDVETFRAERPDEFERWIAPLRGQNLGCWCSQGRPCHVPVLLRAANG